MIVCFLIFMAESLKNSMIFSNLDLLSCKIEISLQFLFFRPQFPFTTDFRLQTLPALWMPVSPVPVVL